MSERLNDSHRGGEDDADAGDGHKEIDPRDRQAVTDRDQQGDQDRHGGQAHDQADDEQRVDPNMGGEPAESDTADQCA